MTNLEFLRSLTDEKLITYLAAMIGDGPLGIADELCGRCMKKHGGRCVIPDCSCGEYSAEKLVKMWAGWQHDGK